MRAGKYNIVCEQGATLSRLISIEYPSTASAGVYLPYDLTGHSARMHVRRTIDSAALLLELTTENGRLVINPAEDINTIHINVSASVTASVTTSGVYDIEIIDPYGVVSRVLSGNFELDPEVTR